METYEAIAALSQWVDDLPQNKARDAEALLLHRTSIKLGEEVGEVNLALIGALGANPRKGTYATMEDVKKELLDVAITALGAWEHIDGNYGNALKAMEDQVASVAARAGL